MGKSVVRKCDAFVCFDLQMAFYIFCKMLQYLMATLMVPLNLILPSLLQVTSGFELYLCFSPLATKALAVSAVNKLLKWIRKEEDRLFILSPLTY